jgi:hypothetical protein
MTPPRWFYLLVAVCLVVLTAASTWHLVRADRYVGVEGWVLDTHTGLRCSLLACNDLSKPAPQATTKAPASVPPPRDPFADLAPPDNNNPFEAIKVRK